MALTGEDKYAVKANELLLAIADAYGIGKGNATCENSRNGRSPERSINVPLICLCSKEQFGIGGIWEALWIFKIALVKRFHQVSRSAL